MLIGLLTDFGNRDYYVAAMKGVIFSINEKAAVFDITHEIDPQAVGSASYVLRSCYSEFPAKTIFVAVVDPGVGSSRRAIAVETEKYYFIAPDNGILGFVYEETPDFRAFEISNEKYFRHPVSKTFHGRDIFAPCAAHLSAGVDIEDLGKRIYDVNKAGFSAARSIGESQMEAEIIHIDRFGNLITSIESRNLPGKFHIELNGRKIKQRRQFYSEAPDGEMFLIAGSGGHLEISVKQASARSILNARIGQKLLLTAVE